MTIGGCKTENRGHSTDVETCSEPKNPTEPNSVDVAMGQRQLQITKVGF